MKLHKGAVLALTDDEMDVKTFMEFHGIGLWPTEHERLVHIFQRAGYTTFRIERSSVCWSLQIFKRDHNLRVDQFRRFLRDLLRKEGIRLDRHEPLFRIESAKLWVYFQTEGGEIGLGLKLAERRNGVVVPCREEYRLAEHECYPEHATEAEVLA
jgi:hypothetical protein